MARRVFMFLTVAALAATILVGCAAGSGGSSPQSAEQQAPSEADSSGQKAESPGSSGKELGHPTLGSADAPVVMTEFSDYQ